MMGHWAGHVLAVGAGDLFWWALCLAGPMVTVFCWFVWSPRCFRQARRRWPATRRPMVETLVTVGFGFLGVAAGAIACGIVLIVGLQTDNGVFVSGGFVLLLPLVPIGAYLATKWRLNDQGIDGGVRLMAALVIGWLGLEAGAVMTGVQISRRIATAWEDAARLHFVSDAIVKYTSLHGTPPPDLRTCVDENLLADVMLISVYDETGQQDLRRVQDAGEPYAGPLDVMYEPAAVGGPPWAVVAWMNTQYAQDDLVPVLTADGVTRQQSVADLERELARTQAWIDEQQRKPTRRPANGEDAR